MCSALVYAGYIAYPSSCNVINVSVKEYLRLAYQMPTYIKTSVSVQFSTCSEGKMLYTKKLTYSLLISCFLPQFRSKIKINGHPFLVVHGFGKEKQKTHDLITIKYY